MLKFLRNRSIQKKLFLGLAIGIIPSFVIWGVMMETDGSGAGSEAGRIGGRSVSTGEFIKSYENLRREIFLFHGVDPSALSGQMDFEKATWERILLLDAARDLKIRTSNEEVLEWLARQESFRRDGKFDPNLYSFFIERQMRTTPREFEENIRSMLTLRKVVESLRPDVRPAEAEVRELFRDRFAPRRLRYVLFSPEPGAPDPVVDEAEVDSLYEQMKNVLLQDGKPMPADQAKAEIRRHVADSERDKRIREKAEAFYNAAAGKGFDEAAKEAGLDVLEAPAFKRGGTLEKAGEIAAFDAAVAPLEPGDLSQPLKTAGGFVVIRVEAIAEAPEEEWAKQKEALERELAEKAVSEAFGRKMDSLWEKLRINVKTMGALFPQKYGGAVEAGTQPTS